MIYSYVFVLCLAAALIFTHPFFFPNGETGDERLSFQWLLWFGTTILLVGAPMSALGWEHRQLLRAGRRPEEANWPRYFERWLADCSFWQAGFEGLLRIAGPIYIVTFPQRYFENGRTLLDAALDPGALIGLVVVGFGLGFVMRRGARAHLNWHERPTSAARR
ncbi:MAG: hypothetical protein H6923_05820 [Alphaproteobacteria bacterium]|nr:hypothetical protein [Alphaproteobacteria bacterium]